MFCSACVLFASLIFTFFLSFDGYFESIKMAMNLSLVETQLSSSNWIYSFNIAFSVQIFYGPTHTPSHGHRTRAYTIRPETLNWIAAYMKIHYYIGLIDYISSPKVDCSHRTLLHWCPALFRLLILGLSIVFSIFVSSLTHFAVDGTFFWLCVVCMRLIHWFLQRYSCWICAK